MRGATFASVERKLDSISFQSTRPMRGATGGAYVGLNYETFQSTRPMRGATTPVADAAAAAAISIHAPHAGRDLHFRRVVSHQDNFNPRAPCGARLDDTHPPVCLAYFNPRAPCGARPSIFAVSAADLAISIHAPHAGRDQVGNRRVGGQNVFQSTRPMRGATRPRSARVRRKDISIHAPHAGRDHCVRVLVGDGVEFQSTRPMRGATTGERCLCKLEIFQSTRPMRGATETLKRIPRTTSHFNPRAPCGARQQK